VYLPVFNKYLSSQNLLNVNTKEDSKRMNFTFSVKLIEDDGTNNFVADLRATAGIKNVNLISSREDIEY
jgi:hypothetical protein